MPRPTLLIALALIPLTIQAQTWPTLTHLKPGTRLQIESIPSPSNPGYPDRCRLLTITPSTLTCTAEADPQVRLIFPIQQVDAIYQINRPRPGIGTILALALTGTFIGGIATLCAPAIGIPLLAGVIALGIWTTHQQQNIQQAIWGYPPPPPPPTDHLKLLYHR